MIGEVLYWIELLDDEDRVQGILDGTSNGTVEQNKDRAVNGSLDFTLLNTGIEIPWLRARFRPWCSVNGYRFPMGIYLTSDPETQVTATHESWRITAHDKLGILDQDATPGIYSLPEGTDVIDTVVGIIEAAGETSLSVTPSSKTLTRSMTWKAGETWLVIVSDLLRAVDYAPLQVAGGGNFLVRPGTDPRERSIMQTFAEGPDFSLHGSEWTHSFNTKDVPNRVVLTTSGTDEQPEMISVAVNENPDSPFSYQARGGRWVTRPYEDIEAVDQSTLDSLARRYLSNASRAVSSFRVSHVVAPLEPNDVVRFRSHGRDVLAEVNEYSITMTAGVSVQALWTEIGPVL